MKYLYLVKSIRRENLRQVNLYLSVYKFSSLRFRSPLQSSSVASLIWVFFRILAALCCRHTNKIFPDSSWRVLEKQWRVLRRNHLICQKKFCDVYCMCVLPEWVYGRANYLQILSSSILLCKLVKNDISIRQ